MEIYDIFKDYIKSVDIKNEKIEVKPFYFIRDHFIIMKMCMEWMKRNNVENTLLDEMISIYERLIEISDDTNLLLLFANKTRRSKQIEILSNIDQMQQIEARIKELVLQCKNYNKCNNLN